jgi:hypothetical protein
MADEFAPALTAMQRKLDEQIQSVNETKRAINMLLKMAGREAVYPETEGRGSLRADQFYGKGLATSAAEYLQIRGQACQTEEILTGLEQGGFDFDVLGWQESDRVRSLAMSLAKNTGNVGKFHRLKNGSFGLRSWYDKDFLEKAAAGATSQAKAKRKAKLKKNKVSPKTKSRPAQDQTAPKEVKPAT